LKVESKIEIKSNEIKSNKYNLFNLILQIYLFIFQPLALMTIFSMQLKLTKEEVQI